jgi:hypothetical protein
MVSEYQINHEQSTRDIRTGGLDRPDTVAEVAPTLDELRISDTPAAWRACGFDVDGDECVLGGVRLKLIGGDPGARGLLGASLSGIDPTANFDGLELSAADRPGPPAAPPHPNGVSGFDHLVAISPDLDRTVAALVAAGLDLRRVREEPTPAGAPRQAFFRLGTPILEVVQAPPAAIERSGGPDGPAFFWGIALVAPDLDRSVEVLGEHVGEARDAVQPGRRIATLKRSAGLSLPVALMTPAAESTSHRPSGEKATPG